MRLHGAATIDSEHTLQTPVADRHERGTIVRSHGQRWFQAEAFTRNYFGDSSALGKRFTFEGQNQPYEIVGVAGDAKYSSLHEAAPRTIYLNAFQEGRGRFSQFALRTNVPPTAVMGDVRRAVRDVLTTVPVAKVTTLADQVDASIVPERLMAKLSGAFGGLGALLAAIGLYGLLAYIVAHRTNEIGIRMALGATRRDVTRMVLKNGSSPI